MQDVPIYLVACDRKYLPVKVMSEIWNHPTRRIYYWIRLGRLSGVDIVKLGQNVFVAEDATPPQLLKQAAATSRLKTAA